MCSSSPVMMTTLQGSFLEGEDISFGVLDEGQELSPMLLRRRGEDLGPESRKAGDQLRRPRNLETEIGGSSPGLRPIQDDHRASCLQRAHSAFMREGLLESKHLLVELPHSFKVEHGKVDLIEFADPRCGGGAAARGFSFSAHGAAIDLIPAPPNHGQPTPPPVSMEPDALRFDDHPPERDVQDVSFVRRFDLAYAGGPWRAPLGHASAS